MSGHAARTPDPGPIFHGANLDAAYERAKSIRGMVIWSAAPGTNGSGPTANNFGYWSDDIGMVRSWEREVYAASQRRALATVKRDEARFPEGGRA